MQIKKYEMEFGGEKLSVEISDLADQTNGSVMVRYGGTAIFASAVMSKNKREGIDFFPLMVDYQEKFYAIGMILGSRFVRREGRPSDEAILTGRLVDRTIRPLFNKKIRNEVQVTVITLSIDQKNDPDVPAILAASLALGISDIPWDGPVGSVRISHLENGAGGMAVNPTFEEKKKAISDIVISGKEGTINMVEAGAKEISEEMAVAAMEKSVEEIKKVIAFQNSIIKDIGKEKRKMEIDEIPAGAEKIFDEEISAELEKTVYEKPKGESAELREKWRKIFAEKFPEAKSSFADDLFEEKIEGIIQKNVLDAPAGREKRPDGRGLDDIRPLYAGVNYLPISHGSGVFYRGGTHVLSVVTLGGPKDAQLIEGMEIQTTKRFMHHYNFPPFSTGETRKMGTPSRREIGHGALVERALSAVIPDAETFPYTIRIVSESMASNGSTSMGSTCASTLALMDAGVPIKAPVAGIAMGIISREPLAVKKDDYKLLTDIQGMEDHYGGMDFKVTGTEKGITAIQLDLKLEGLSVEALKEALEKSKIAREKVMAEILKAIPSSRKELSPSAPRITILRINPQKIGEVIGPGGKIINNIIEKTGVEIDIEQDGRVFITAKNHKDAEAAQKIIEELVREFQIGEIIEGEVIKILDFGAIVDLGGGKDGMIHISELKNGYVEKVEDAVKIGEKVKAKIIKVENGRIGLSIKQLNK